MAPPLQLVPGDKFNLTLGVLGAITLASCKDLKSLHPFVKWSLNAYTNWNLAFITLGAIARQHQWHPFLLVNSMGIFLGFRTAFCQGLDENMRKKVRDLGFELVGNSRKLFLFADHMCHTVPVITLLWAVVSRKQRVHPMNSIYAIILSTWFSFRQSAQLDASDLYVPHPWKRAWAAIFTGVAFTPALVDALIQRRNGKAVSVCRRSKHPRCEGDCRLLTGPSRLNLPSVAGPVRASARHALALREARPGGRRGGCRC